MLDSIEEKRKQWLSFVLCLEKYELLQSFASPLQSPSASFIVLF